MKYIETIILDKRYLITFWAKGVCGFVGHMLVKLPFTTYNVCTYLCSSSVLLHILQCRGKGCEDLYPSSYYTVQIHCTQQFCQLCCESSWFLLFLRQKVDTYLHKEQCGPSWHNRCQLDRHHISGSLVADPFQHIRCQCLLWLRQSTYRRFSAILQKPYFESIGVPAVLH